MSESKKPSLAPVPDLGVSDRSWRRTCTAECALRILRELDAVAEPGQAGEVLRREGPYTSHITDWRRKRAAGELQGLGAKKLGRPPKARNPLEPEVARLERELALPGRSSGRPTSSSRPKKVSEVLGIPARERTGRNG